jgi:hypothetical protein
MLKPLFSTLCYTDLVKANSYPISNIDVTAKSYKYALACINIPLAVFAWATPAACLVAQGVPR